MSSASSLSLIERNFDIWDHIARLLHKHKRMFVDPQGKAHLETEPWEPMCEMVDKRDHYVLRVDLPGVDKSSITLTLDNDKVLRVRGEKKRDDEGYTRFCELVYGFFDRSVSIPGDVDTSALSASSDNGVLTVILPKSKLVVSTRIVVN
eukprot:m51a1_g11821 hypothetical protein (149) ;mRNA; f:411152-411726